jgi:cation transport ATPase
VAFLNTSGIGIVAVLLVSPWAAVHMMLPSPVSVMLWVVLRARVAHRARLGLGALEPR